MRNLTLAVLAIIISLVSFFLVKAADERSVSNCVSKADFDQSLSYFFRYAGPFNTGRNILVPESVKEFYGEQVNCIESHTFASPEAKATQYEKLKTLYLVKEVTVADDQVCIELVTTGGRECVKK